MDHMMNNITTGLGHSNATGYYDFDCHGDEYLVALSGGTYKGHFIPAMIFLCWGLWWALQASSRHQRAVLTGAPESTEALGWYEFSCCWFRLTEPLLKAFGSPLGILMELRLDHPRWL